jgi:hypothetical protein
MLQRQQRPQHVDGECGFVVGRGLLDDRAQLPFGARVVDRDIEPAEPLYRAIDQIADLAFVADVRANELGFATQRA